jgi:hypothetical protein
MRGTADVLAFDPTVARTIFRKYFGPDEADWDRRLLCLMRRWATGDVCSGAYDGGLFNAALQPLLELIPPERAAAAAVLAAEEVDALLLEVSDEVVAAALARPDAPNLDRGSHRGYHLDQIEQALARASHAGARGGFCSLKATE